jgi:predicted PurR-regulated permease PerM
MVSGWRFLHVAASLSWAVQAGYALYHAAERLTRRCHRLLSVIPANALIQAAWIPAFTGMTPQAIGQSFGRPVLLWSMKRRKDVDGRANHRAEPGGDGQARP